MQFPVPTMLGHEFGPAQGPSDDVEAPPGWKRFYALRNADDENEVITFGLFDGTLDELRSGQGQGGEYDRRSSEAEQFVDSKGADGVYEVVEERVMG
jgi:hypothetical protein